MGTRAFAVLVAVVFGGVIGACKSDLLPDRCDKDGDCKSRKCDLSEKGNGRCLPQDAGGSDATDGGSDDAGDAGDAHDAFSCEVATCGGETPVCDLAMMKCRKCGAASECMTLNAPVCAPTGACVACLASTDCSLSGAPICKPETNTCTACTADDQCVKRAPATPGCASGKCVECTLHSHCGTAKPICDVATNTCVGCKTTDNKCAARGDKKPVCTATGTCVECVTNADCEGETPICDKTSNTCKPCKADAECTDGPKVCMSHQKGRCASDAETIYVQKVASCPGSAATADGTATKPYCSMDPAVASLNAATTKDLIVVSGTVGSATAGIAVGTRKVSIVGQLNAVIAGADTGIHVSTGDAYVRSVKLGPSPSVGFQADSGTVLRLDKVLVTGNSGGGILLNGAAFEIQNTTIASNGPGTSGATTWGGILVTNPPAAGPAKLNLVTIQNNMGGGIACSASLTMATGVLSSGNESPNINATCMFTSCGTASASCGAQP
jgi:hypothetical protein